MTSEDRQLIIDDIERWLRPALDIARLYELDAENIVIGRRRKAALVAFTDVAADELRWDREHELGECGFGEELELRAAMTEAEGLLAALHALGLVLERNTMTGKKERRAPLGAVRGAPQAIVELADVGEKLLNRVGDLASTTA